MSIVLATVLTPATNGQVERFFRCLRLFSKAGLFDSITAQGKNNWGTSIPAYALTAQLECTTEHPEDDTTLNENSAVQK